MTSETTQSPDDADDAARQEGQRAVRAAVLRMARAAGTEIQERPIAPGLTSTWQYATPADGIKFALMLQHAAQQQVHEYIRHGRQEGMDWKQIGEALRLGPVAKEHGASLAEVAFEYATDAEHADRFATLSFYWSCPSCGQGISDRGPYESHPEDNEQGHAAGCERLARLVAEHDARWADE